MIILRILLMIILLPVALVVGVGIGILKFFEGIYEAVGFLITFCLLDRWGK